MAPTEPEPPPERNPLARPWCLFRCERRPYAVGLGAVDEVVEVDRLVPLPLSPPRVIGLCARRREVLPVVGIERAAPEAEVQGPRRWDVMVLRTSRGVWGVWVDPEGTTVAEEPLDPAPPGGAGSASVAVLGTVRRNDTAYLVIDPEATWRALRSAADGWYGRTS